MPLTPKDPMAKILVVDDDGDILRFVTMCLEDQHDVVCTTNGEKALILAKDTAFDVVVTDIFMPMKDGLEVVQALARSSPKTKIIAMTSEKKGGKMNFLNVALHMGATATLAKPFAPDQVRQVVAEVLASDTNLHKP